MMQLSEGFRTDPISQIGRILDRKTMGECSHWKHVTGTRLGMRPPAGVLVRGFQWRWHQLAAVEEGKPHGPRQALLRQQGIVQ